MNRGQGSEWFGAGGFLKNPRPQPLAAEDIPKRRNYCG